jgi:uncharacterized membrane protein
MSQAIHIIHESATALKLILEGLSVIVIACGIVAILYYSSRALFRWNWPSYYKGRLAFARFLVIALEFQLAADVIGTAVAPDFEQIGKLGAIAVIRTFLNYFLMREIREEEERVKGAAVTTGLQG